MTMTAVERKIKTIESATKEIESKQKLIAKKQSKIESGTLDQWDVRWAEEDIQRLTEEIKELTTKIENAKVQLGKAQAKADALEGIPEVMKQLRDSLVEHWDGSDARRQAFQEAQLKELGYSKFIKAFGYSAYEFVMYETTESIHKNNVREADNTILNTVERIKNITGEITDVGKYLTVEPDNNGCMILNGLIRGEKGTAILNSIYAGGYNIQRLHIRVLVAPYKN